MTTFTEILNDSDELLGRLPVQMPTFSHIQRIAMLGDSLTEMNEWGLSASAISQAAGVATATCANSLVVGDVVYIHRANEADYNGWKTVASANASSFTFAIAVTAPASATVISGETTFSVRTGRQIPGSAWAQWMNGRLGGAIEIVLNAGVGGDTIAQASARVDEVLASGADTVSVICGHNDLFWSAGADVPAVFAEFTDLCDTFLDNGKRVIVSTLITTAAASGVATACRQNVQRFNHLLKEWATATPGVLLADAHAAMVDATSATGASRAYVHQADNIHLSNLGGDLFGTAVYNAISKFTLGNSILPDSALVSAPQIFSNPTLQGAAGGTAGVTGTAPTGTITAIFGGSGSYTAAVPARTAGNDGDALGNNASITSASAGVGSVLLMGTGDLAGSLGGATKVWAAAHVQIAGASRFNGMKIGLLAKVGSVEYWSTALEWWDGMQTGMQDINLVLRTPLLTLPAGLTELAWYIQGTVATAGAITVKYGRLGVFTE